MRENKKDIIFRLKVLLKATRAGDKIENLTYMMCENGEEYVRLELQGGIEKKVCITADSGIAMIMDVCRAL